MSDVSMLRPFRPAGRAALGLVALATVFLIGVLPTATAGASQQIDEFVVTATSQQAGSHPDLLARFKLEGAGEPEVAKRVTVDLPTGIFGNPGAIFKCRAADFATNECQPGSQVGLITVVANYEGNPNNVLGTTPVYNMETLSDDETALLSFVVPTINVPVSVPISVRSDADYGLRLVFPTIPQKVALVSAALRVWGSPASPEHDAERFKPGAPGSPPGCPGATTASCNTAPFPKAGIQPSPYIDSPSVCTGQPLPVRIEVVTYQDPAPSSATGEYAPITGCENQKFDPHLELGLTTVETDSPSGLNLRLRAEQFLETIAPSQSTLRSATVVLPPGLTLNPDAADGQTSCSEDAANFGTMRSGECPDNSKIGTMEVHTPALDGPLVGSLYLGEPEPGNQYRLFMIFDGFGVHAKLIADVLPDPETGQLTVRVEDIPQVPFEQFDLHLFASDRGLVATPTHCRIYTAQATLVPWNGALSPQGASPIVGLDKGPNGTPCPAEVRPFNPRLIAGMSTTNAGDFSSFTLNLERDDGDQFLGDLTFRMPPGFTGDLRGIDYCPEASIAAAAQKPGRQEQVAPSCPLSSQIGTTNVAAGPGSHPFHALGRMYLSGPLKGAPLSLAAITPALAGPYDYGTQVVRVALNVDPQTAQVSAVSEPMPQIIGGIPLRMRTIRVNIDRPRFTINPTNCSPFSVDSQGIGDQGTVTNFSSYFQAVNCSTLSFKPRMTIRQLGGKGQTKRSKNPRLRFDLHTRPGDANLRSVAVTLPKAFAIDQRHLGNICSRAQLQAELCRGRQPIGSAFVKTPLLDEPLRGPAYAVSGFGKLPRVAFILDGQVRIIPQAQSSSVRGGHLRTVVPVIPDAPVGHFRLTLLGGSKGYLSNTRDLCRASTITRVNFVGQNGKRRNQRVAVKTPCGKRKRASRSSHSRR